MCRVFFVYFNSSGLLLCRLCIVCWWLDDNFYPLCRRVYPILNFLSLIVFNIFSQSIPILLSNRNIFDSIFPRKIFTFTPTHPTFRHKHYIYILAQLNPNFATSKYVMLKFIHVVVPWFIYYTEIIPFICMWNASHWFVFFFIYFIYTLKSNERGTFYYCAPYPLIIICVKNHASIARVETRP